MPLTRRIINLLATLLLMMFAMLITDKLKLSKPAIGHGTDAFYLMETASGMDVVASGRQEVDAYKGDYHYVVRFFWSGPYAKGFLAPTRSYYAFSRYITDDIGWPVQNSDVRARIARRLEQERTRTVLPTEWTDVFQPDGTYDKSVPTKVPERVLWGGYVFNAMAVAAVCWPVVAIATHRRYKRRLRTLQRLRARRHRLQAHPLPLGRSGPTG